MKSFIVTLINDVCLAFVVALAFLLWSKKKISKKITTKVLPKSFHLNGNTTGFYPRFQISCSQWWIIFTWCVQGERGKQITVYESIFSSFQMAKSKSQRKELYWAKWALAEFLENLPFCTNVQEQPAWKVNLSL